MVRDRIPISISQSLSRTGHIFAVRWSGQSSRSVLLEHGFRKGAGLQCSPVEEDFLIVSKHRAILKVCVAEDRVRPLRE